MDQLAAAPSSVAGALGATVLLPLVVLVTALALRVSPGRAIRSAMTVGLAFVGIDLVLGLMLSTYLGVGQGLVHNFGLHRDILDVGWPAVAAIAFGSAAGIWVIPMMILVNMALLKARLTRTVNLDLWNFWHFAFLGALVQAATGSVADGLAAAALMGVLSLVVADWTAKGVQQFYGIEGVSVPHFASAQIVPLAILVNWIMDRVPALDAIAIDPVAVQKRLGLFGEPVILAFAIGFGLGLASYAGAADVGMVLAQALKTAVVFAAAVLLLPRVVKVLMEGLVPLTEAAQGFVERWAGGREIYVGLDSAILVGHPATVAASLILVPVAILLSIVLPGNRVMLLGDLAVLPFLVAQAAPIVRGSVIRLVAVGLVTLVIGFYVGTALAPLMAHAARTAGFAVPPETVGLTAVVDGFLYVPYLVVVAVRAAGAMGLAAIGIAVAALLLVVRQWPDRWSRWAGGTEDAAATAQAAE